MKKVAALLLCALLMTSALADIEWPTALNSGQAALRNYVDTVNLTLTQMDAGVIDMQYELYPAFASLGMDGEETAESCEMYFQLGEGGLYSLTLRLCDPDRFEQVAAACLSAASTAISLESARKLTATYAQVLRDDLAALRSNPEIAMTHSFEEAVEAQQGDQPRAYFAYYPNQFGNGHAYLQMTLIFARPGSGSGALSTADATPAPYLEDAEYEGYFSKDNYNHLEIFATPTPEPDSAAMENW